MASVGDLAVVGAVASMSMADVDMTVGKQSSSPKLSFCTCISYILALASIVTAVGAMVIEGTTIVYVATTISLVVALVATVQRFVLSRNDSFRQVHNALRQDVNRFQQENNALGMQLTHLQTQAEKVRTAEAKLKQVVGQQGQQVDTFVYEVKQNGIVLKQTQALLITQVMQTVLSVILQSDMDQDFVIDDNEISVLVLRVKALPGVDEVDEQRFRQLLAQKGTGLDTVKEIVRIMTQDKQRLIRVSSRRLVR